MRKNEKKKELSRRRLTAVKDFSHVIFFPLSKNEKLQLQTTSLTKQVDFRLYVQKWVRECDQKKKKKDFLRIALTDPALDSD